MSILSKRINSSAFNSYLYAHYSVKSAYETYKTKRKHKIIIENKFNGGLVVVMALYERSVLRPDVERYLKSLRGKGAFIVAANTSSLSEETIKDKGFLFDVYIERDNLGRDFGSYKDCFQYLFKNGINNNCSRLIMCNDSVYYSQDGMDKFLTQMIETEKSVLGATENHDFHRHVGSFYISISSKITSNKKFISYWDSYAKTNVRPKIIKTGELALSKLLLTLSDNEMDFDSLYNMESVERDVKTLHETIDYIKAFRNGDYDRNHTTLMNEMIKSNVVVRSHLHKYMKEKIKLLVESDKYVSEKYLRSRTIDGDFLDFMSFLDTLEPNQPLIRELLNAFRSMFMEVFTQGSQIHFNAIAFKRLGLPIIKLDIMHRHAYGVYDFLRLVDEIKTDEERREFKNMMLPKMSGRNYIFGFKRKAFIQGYI